MPPIEGNPDNGLTVVDLAIRTSALIHGQLDEYERVIHFIREKEAAGESTGVQPGVDYDLDMLDQLREVDANRQEVSRQIADAEQKKRAAAVDAAYHKAVADDSNLPPAPGEFHDGVPLTDGAKKWYAQQVANAPHGYAPAPDHDDGGLSARDEQQLSKFLDDDPVTGLTHAIFDARATARQAKGWLALVPRPKTE